ncbi:MAG: hypothetical protein NPINA01_21120 [Nitrospinaceae bacterium]|nr:MAG: hypothetical protein NPINA01_21120 [Nitrospinaceae bacterium]
MTFRLFFKFIFPLVTLLAVGPIAEAQENASGTEQEGLELAENIIEVEVETFQSNALKNFLKEYRQILQQSKSDTSGVLQKFRKDFSDLKQENARSLKITRQKKLPRVVLKRVNPNDDLLPTKNPDPAPFSRDLLRMEKFHPPPLAPEQKDRLLSLDERQRLAKIVKKRRQETFQFRQSEIGRLKAEIDQEPLKGHQTKLAEFSARIKKWLAQIERGRGREPALFLNLGNVYLESQRYLNSLEREDRFKLTRYAPHAGIALGSYELALWTFKMSLTQNPDDGDTNLLLGKVLAEMGRPDQALERARNAEYLFSRNRESGKTAQARSFVASLEKPSPIKFNAEP